MAIGIREILEGRFREYESFKQEQEYYSAILRLAELWNCLPALPNTIRSEWASLINSQFLPDVVIQAILSGVTNKVERLRKILSFGSKYNDDEIVLILTFRIQIEMVLALLKGNFSQEHIIFMGDIDEAIKNLASSKLNKKPFADAVSQVRNNWGLPIRSEWLDITD